MRPFRSSIVLVVLVAAFACSSVHAADGPETFPFDPVLLITTGQELEGKETYVSMRGRYRYVFATPENKASFDKEPDRFEIQQGGACARMGPLSGSGRIELFVVVKEKLYLCASDGCRQTFAADPDSLLEGDDPPPNCTDESIKRGRELLQKAVLAAGGDEKLDALRSYQTRMKSKHPTYSETASQTVLFPESFHRTLDWGSSWWNLASCPNGAWFETKKGADEMADSQRRAFVRQVYRDPLVILRARTDPSFVCAAIGPGDFYGTMIEQVQVAIRGATTNLMIEPDSGRVVGVGHRGRGPRATMGHIDVIFSDFERLAGDITLPRTRTVMFDGESIAEGSGTLESIAIDAEVPAKMFAKPNSR